MMSIERIRKSIRNRIKKKGSLRLSLNRTIMKMRAVFGNTGPKLFVIGFNKTGTTSINKIFKELNIPSYHGLDWRSGEKTYLLNSYKCFSDGGPNSSDVEELDAKFPGSKFLLQVRDLDTWVLSRLKHINRRKRIGKYEYQPLFDTTEEAIRHWVISRNIIHISYIEYFLNRPNDFLLLNFIRDRDSAGKILNLIGEENRRISKPHVNETISTKNDESHVEMFRSVMKSLSIPPDEWSYDIYCPSLVAADSIPPFPPDSGGWEKYLLSTADTGVE